MKCKKAHSLISHYVDESLEGPECAALEAHLRVCVRCSEEVEAISAMLNDLGSLCGCKSPVDCWEHVRSCVADPVAAEPIWRRFVVRPVAAVPMFAAALLLLVFLIWPSSTEQQGGLRSPVAAPEYARYLAAHSQVPSHPAFSDPDAAFAAAELEAASLRSDGGR